MKVLNKGIKDVPVSVPDRYGKFYTIYILPNRVTELEPTQVSKDLMRLIDCGKLIRVDEEPTIIEESNEETIVEESNEETIVEDIKEDDITVESEESSEEESNISDEVIEESNEETIVEEVKDIYKCEICGYEASTSRGLKTHMSRAHKNEK